MRSLALLAILAVLFAAGCGLPSPYFLEPPGYPKLGFASDSTPIFYVESTTANSEPEFRGFELYYKCYKDEASIEYGFGTGNQESDLKAAGFLPVCTASDLSPQGRSVPLIPIESDDRGSEFTITLNFNAPDTAAYEYTGPISTTVVSTGVRRYVFDVDSGTGCKTFAYDQFSPSDPDISAIHSQLSGAVYIAMYALSYGKQDLATTIWSTPVYLGWAKIIP
jgi:hypothetical protein